MPDENIKHLSVIDLYKPLDLEFGVKSRIIYKRFIELSKQYHPEFNKSSEARQKFLDINVSYYILEDKGFKKDYDKLYRKLLLKEAVTTDVTEAEKNLAKQVAEAKEVSSKYLNYSYKKFYRKIPKDGTAGNIFDFFLQIFSNI